jgi:serine/threonine-protein kinase RsbW
MIYTHSRNTDCLHLEMSANLANVDRTVKTVKKFILDNGLGRHSFALILGTREALNNAVLSGCRLDPNLRVVFYLVCEPGRVVITVKDQGGGFDWRSYMGQIPSGTIDSGRGLPIFQAYFDTVQYNEQGNSVTLVKTI